MPLLGPSATRPLVCFWRMGRGWATRRKSIYHPKADRHSNLSLLSKKNNSQLLTTHFALNSDHRIQRAIVIQALNMKQKIIRHSDRDQTGSAQGPRESYALQITNGRTLCIRH